jgi:hypothetical protein
MDKSVYDLINSRVRGIKTFLNGIEDLNYKDIFDIVQNTLFGERNVLSNYQRDEALKKNTTIFPSELLRGVDDDYSVTYTWNTLGFRCDEFKKEHDKKHILFMGCSETVGIGGNLDEAWAHILYKKLSEIEESTGYFNIAVSGSGPLEQIIRYRKYEKEYGKPDEIYMMIPDSYRGYVSTASNNVQWGMPISEPSGIFYNKGTYLSFLFNNLSAMAEFEVYCIENNIKFAWSLISEEQTPLFKKLPFKNFIPMEFPEGYFAQDKFFRRQREYRYEGFEKNLVKRDGHFGCSYHQYWADRIFDETKYNKTN